MKEKPQKKDFEQMLLRNKDSICKIAYAYLKNRDDVLDAYQTVFLNYFNYLPEFENEKHEKAWFARTTVNVCKNMCSNTWKKKVGLVEDNETFANLISKENATGNDGSNWITDLVLALPEKYRIVIHLFYYEEYSIEEIADIVGISKTNVKVRLSRARKMLEKLAIESN